MRELKEETETVKLFWDSETEIAWCVVQKDIPMVEQAEDNITAQERLRDGLNKEKTRVLVDMTLLTKTSKEVREYFANERTAAVQRATALLVGSPITRVIGTFFMGLNRPLSPTRMFTDPDEAVQWLHTFSDA